MSKKKIKKRDFIAKELLTSGKYRMKVVPNKKKKVDKFNWKKETESSLKQIRNSLFKTAFCLEHI